MRARSPVVPILITAHFVALFISPLPRGDGAFGRLPDPIRAPIAAVVPPVATAVGSVSDRYVRFLALEQHWSFFAPNPLADAPVVIATVYGKPEGAPVPASAEGWESRVVTLPSPLDPERPRILRRRDSYLLLKGSEPGVHPAYHRAIARWACELGEASTSGGSAPDAPTPGAARWIPAGVRLRTNWYPAPIPWREAPPTGPLVEDVAGFPCPVP